MTAPNEPGQPGPGPHRVAESGETPPRQRNAPQPPRTRPAPPGPARAPEAPGAPQIEPGGHSPGVNERVRRFVAGGNTSAAPAGPVKPAPGGPEAPPADAYASELPDLSGPSARPPQRQAAAQRLTVSSRPQGPVRASMQIRRIDPWSTLRVALLLNVALFFAWMFAVAFLYLVLGSMGVWSKLNSNVGDLLTNNNGATELVSTGTIFGGALLIGLVNIVLLTAMATLGAVIYNLSTDVVGGIEVTLADRD